MSSKSPPVLAGQWAIHRLPVEVVVLIMKASPSLSALWSFITTSALLSAIFHEHALEITEAVLSDAVFYTNHEQTQAFIHAVFQLRLAIQPRTLDDATNPPQPNTDSLKRRLLSIPAPKPEALRGFVCLAHKLHVLAHEYLEDCLRECMAIRPLSVDDQTLMDCLVSDQPKRYYDFTRHRGKPYQPKDTGPPSWTEEQLVILNLWQLQYYIDLRKALAAGRLEWSESCCEEFREMDIWSFYEIDDQEEASHLFRQEQIMTILEYLLKKESIEQDMPGPRSPPYPTTRFNLGCTPEQRPRRRDPKSLEFGAASPGHLEFYQRVPLHSMRPTIHPAQDTWRFSKNMAQDNINPIMAGRGPECFRRFGFCLWDKTRMIDWGLLPPRPLLKEERLKYYIRWRSLLNDEDYAFGAPRFPRTIVPPIFHRYLFSSSTNGWLSSSLRNGDYAGLVPPKRHILRHPLNPFLYTLPADDQDDQSHQNLGHRRID
ncbi:hypothetical protein NPX13_g6440 [Xylaria arbuscula]|uniref:Uncharacterized protein n=1 Tax=Xylaria arbuscula TaxID=114810 RepID=A0A9W8NCJ0_9PEZI|nr:hypothetical protein NPX13_g6440 [Xylaria arbuscula]